VHFAKIDSSEKILVIGKEAREPETRGFCVGTILGSADKNRFEAALVAEKNKDR